ncbi:hypothetical protein F5Y03DRAFT_383429 [Xylaria venustula]|nr:hypothetical protein F5Y03DRAFT_383429 [Xylaria venustula]
MDESNKIEELERRLRDAEARAEQEQRRAEKAEKGRDDERQRAEKAEKGQDDERQRAEKAEKGQDDEREKTRSTSLDEYIAGCHELVFTKLKVEKDKVLTSKGSITNPRNKTIFGQLYVALPPDHRVFENRSFLVGLGDRISQRTVKDEKTLEHFLHLSVEDPVKAIMDQLKKVDQVQTIFDIGDGIVFENHPNAISEAGDEVITRAAASMPPQTPHRYDRNQLRPDQICVYRSDDGPLAERTMIYVCEYKPPHKLTPPHLRRGLRPMNLYKEVVNRKTIPTSADPDKQFEYHAEKLTAAALTQTYHYMIQGGLDFGLLTTGEAIVFLKVDWDEPETLLYHLAEPEFEVAAHPNHIQSCAAVGQYLAFGLLALGFPDRRRQHGQDERQQVIGRLKTWAEDFESTIRFIRENERESPDASSDYAPTSYSECDRSPIILRKPRLQLQPEADVPSRVTPRHKSPSSSDDESAPNPPDTPSPTARRAPGQEVRRSNRILAQRPRGDSRPDGQRRRYCTQQCLLGLVNRGPLDPRCPNVRLHHPRQSDVLHNYARALHPVRHDEWLRQLSQQLEQSLDDGVTKLGEQGARGVLFRVTMLAYGYTFVCKGTVQSFITDLEHESAVYERLRPVQGNSVPVFLGSIDLRSIHRTYYYDHRVYIIYMMFLSWGGCSLDGVNLVDGRKEQVKARTLQALHSIHKEGVVHEDMRTANILLNPETQDVMLIDFERALLLDPPRRPLGQLIPNKRTREQDTGYEKAGARPHQRFANDKAMAKLAFCEW